MKGIIRRIDNLGRVVVPREWMNWLAIKSGSVVALELEQDVIKIQKTDSKYLGRRVDNLNRITLPIEMRRDLNICERAMVDIYVEDNFICIEKAKLQCAYCCSQNEDDLKEVDGIFMCSKCRNK